MHLGVLSSAPVKRMMWSYLYSSHKRGKANLPRRKCLYIYSALWRHNSAVITSLQGELCPSHEKKIDHYWIVCRENSFSAKIFIHFCKNYLWSSLNSLLFVETRNHEMFEFHLWELLLPHLATDRNFHSHSNIQKTDDFCVMCFIYLFT